MLSTIIAFVILYLVVNRLRGVLTGTNNDHAKEDHSAKDEYYWYNENSYKEDDFNDYDDDYDDDRPLSGPWNRTSTGDSQPVPAPSRPVPVKTFPPKPVALPEPDTVAEGYGYDWSKQQKERVTAQEPVPTKPAPKRSGVTPAPTPSLPVVSRHKTWSADNPLAAVLSNKNTLIGGMIVGEVIDSRGGRSGKRAPGANRKR